MQRFLRQSPYILKINLSNHRNFSKLVGEDVVRPTIGLDEDARTFYDLAKSFADNEMKPYAQQWDENGTFPMETFKKFAEIGFAGISTNSDYGGSGLSRHDNTVIIEALATGCVGTTAMLTIHNMCGGMIDKFGNDEQKSELLPKLSSLEMMASYCLTEPGSGSDAAGMASTAKLNDSGTEYTLNGGKAFISGAGLSDIYLVMCKADNGITCLMVDKDSDGLSFGANEKKMGWKVQPTRQIIFDNVKVPIDKRLNEEGNGFKMAMTGLDGGRLSIAACSLGAAQACFEIALNYAKERKQFGKSIAEQQATQFRLANMAGDIHASRLAIRSAAKLLDEGSPAATVHCAMAKKLATDLGFGVCNESLQILGGYGYLNDYHIERYLRDVRVHQILEGTNEIMRHIIGRALVAPN